MVTFILKSLFTPAVMKSLLRHGIVLVGGALGYQAYMSDNSTAAVASALFTIGATTWGWYTAHKTDAAEKAVTASLNKAQLAPQTGVR